MSAGIGLYAISIEEHDIPTPARDFFPDLLKRAQNPDGGWGYRPELPSTTEPTAWAVLALQGLEEPSSKTLASAADWLRRAQMKEGAWPTASGKDPGCWVSALACLALIGRKGPPPDAVVRGANWLCETWPAEGNLLWRLRLRRQNQDSVVHQDHSLQGWGWTPNTASWVEPTAYVLILLQNIPAEHRPAQAGKRIQLGEKMLYDRACPGGGWNAGNPLVYGVPGVPRISPTVWALLALRNHKDRAANQEGVEWLHQQYQDLRSPASLALAHLCLNVYGRAPETPQTQLEGLYSNNGFLQSIPAIAWASLALNGLPCWLGCASQAKDAK
ncbi:MAG TPA: prenyltransferase/squalene oxidase repeat-containing protein [Terriglobia bacterium]|nr:prenyltransferase/squalene oxidase repeat-containing protein [Terriglobia bacterium]